MLKRRDFLKEIMVAGTGVGSSSFFSNSGICHLIDLPSTDNSHLVNTNNESVHSHLMDGCMLTTLARVVNTHRTEISGWKINEDDHNWVEIDAYCLGLNYAEQVFPLHMMFLGNDLIKAQEIKMQEKIAKAKGQTARDLIERIKDKVLEDLKKDAIIVVSGSFFTEEPVHYFMNPRYQLLPRKFLEEKGRELFMNSERIKQLKQKISGYSCSDNYIPHC